MDSNPQQPRHLSEIGHLFLSSIRQRQGGDSPRPVRVPPPKMQPEPAAPPAEELTPEEYAQVARGEDAPCAETTPIPPISAVIVQHLNGKAHQRVREYARHLAANGQRVGVIEADASELILSRFERSIEPTDHPEAVEIIEHFDQRLVTQTMEEMNWDLDRWLLVLPNARSPEARALLKEIDRWIVLATCDHDGVVSCYRTLKGLTDVHQPGISLALLDAPSEVVAQRIFKKLNNVCVQFLGIEIDGEDCVRPTKAVAEHLAVHCRLTHDKAQLAAGAQWLMLTEFLARAKSQEALAPAKPAAVSANPDSTPAEESDTAAFNDAPEREPVAQTRPSMTMSTMPEQTPRDAFVNPPQPAPIRSAHSLTGSDAMDEVIDLVGDGASDETIVSAVLAHAGGAMVACPVRPPMCPAASLAVTRDRGLVLIAVAQKGLGQLNSIAQAYRWLTENRSLIAMALPQFAIDAHQHPRLTLLVDHSDSSAQILAPMLANGSVTVQSYRKLRWHGRTGLLLEAA